eukprot:11333547-Ditylum_brightwellii.AAC.1
MNVAVESTSVQGHCAMGGNDLSPTNNPSNIHIQKLFLQVVQKLVDTHPAALHLKVQNQTSAILQSSVTSNMEHIMSILSPH